MLHVLPGQYGVDVQQTNAQGHTALEIVNMYADPRTASVMKQVLQGQCPLTHAALEGLCVCVCVCVCAYCDVSLSEQMLWRSRPGPGLPSIIQGSRLRPLPPTTLHPPLTASPQGSATSLTLEVPSRWAWHAL